MKKVKNEEFTGENEEKRDVCNLIINESVEVADMEATKEKDKEFARYLIETIYKDATVKSIFRLGKKASEKTRPIKVILNPAKDKKDLWEPIKTKRY